MRLDLQWIGEAGRLTTWVVDVHTYPPGGLLHE